MQFWVDLYLTVLEILQKSCKIPPPLKKNLLVLSYFTLTLEQKYVLGFSLSLGKNAFVLVTVRFALFNQKNGARYAIWCDTVRG